MANASAPTDPTRRYTVTVTVKDAAGLTSTARRRIKLR
jgi:hypothetical protein